MASKMYIADMPQDLYSATSSVAIGHQGKAKPCKEAISHWLSKE